MSDGAALSACAEFVRRAHVQGWRVTANCTGGRKSIPRSSGKSWRSASCTGSRSGRTCSNGTRRSSSGSPAARPTSPTTAWTGTYDARKNKAAIIWEGEPGDQRTLTYQELHRLVCRFANVLKARGLKAGDRAVLYMPMVPELAVAMLACARLGITHSVVFGGFSAEALKARIEDLGRKAVITADGGWRRGKQVPLKATVDEALEGSTSAT